MKLTLEQAATRLGKTQRQVRYLIQQGRLPAEKIGGRWSIDSDDLSLNKEQRRSTERKQRQMRAAVEEALELESEEERPRRYSVLDLKAFQVALPLYNEAQTELGEDHPATRALQRVLEHLSRGCHRFERGEKAEAYRAARDEASLAVCELVLARSESADRILHGIEQDLMAAFAGLMRRVDGRRRW